MNQYQDQLNKYIEYYETLTPRSVRLIEKIADPQMRFKDPFNEVEGISKVVDIMRTMFDDVENPSFAVEDHAWCQDGRTAILKWIFTYGRENKQKRFTGMSEILFAPNGLIVSHVDFWDTGEHVYERIPVLGSIIRLIKRKIAAH